MTPNLIAPRAILFDWDNTLVDSWPCIHTAMSATLTAMDQTPWTMEETKRRVALSLRNAFPPLFGDRWEEARDIYFHHYAANHKTSVVPLPGAAEMLTALDVMGVRMAVVSNKTGWSIEEIAGRVQALKGVSLTLAGGELALLMGPSGSGKTTLLSILGCMLTATGGTVLIRGQSTAGAAPEDLAKLRREHVGFVFQSYHLFPTLCAVDNVRLALDVRGRIPRDRPAVVMVVGVPADRPVVVVAVNEPGQEAGLSAGVLVGIAARALGGGGGGKPDVAQGGGAPLTPDRSTDVINEAFDAVRGALRDIPRIR